MTGVGSATWLFWAAAAVLALAGLALGLWALLADRARGRCRCPRCWYDMSGTDGLTCSECGKTVKAERKLYRTRRRWRWAMLGLVAILASGVLALQPKVQRDGWWSLISNRMLIRGLPLAWSAEDFWCTELDRRMLGDQLTREEWIMLFERTVAGDWLARPISRAWQRKYGMQIAEHRPNVRFMPRDGLAAEVQDILYDIPPEIGLEIRDVWPEGEPLIIQTRYKHWWPYRAGVRMRVTRHAEGAPLHTFHSSGGAVVLDPLPPGEHEITFEVLVDRQHHERRGRDHEWETLDAREITVPVTIRGRAEDLMTPVVSKRIDDLFIAEQTVYLQKRSWGGAGPVIIMGETEKAGLDDIAFGLVAEFLLNGEVVGSKEYWWRPGSDRRGGLMGEEEGDFTPLLEAGDDDELTVRLRSVPELAIRVVDADRYWAGEVEFPLEIHEPRR